MLWGIECSSFFFFNDTATTEIYTLSLHDALPISRAEASVFSSFCFSSGCQPPEKQKLENRSEEHTSELQSPDHIVCRLLLEKKKHSRYRNPPLQNFVPPASAAPATTYPRHEQCRA